jgi:hypothetical protein
MSTFMTSLYRDVTCAAAATLITLVLGVSFLQSTSVAPGTQVAAPAASGYPATNG